MRNNVSKLTWKFVLVLHRAAIYCHSTVYSSKVSVWMPSVVTGCCKYPVACNILIFILELVPLTLLNKGLPQLFVQASELALCKLMEVWGGWWMVICLWILFIVLTSSVNPETGVTTQRLVLFAVSYRLENTIVMIWPMKRLWWLSHTVYYIVVTFGQHSYLYRRNSLLKEQ